MDGAVEAREAIRAGLRLTRAAWRDAWAPLAVCSAGWTAVHVAGRAGLPPDSAAALAWTGLALVLLMTPPKLGALHRLAAGGQACDPPGPAGLQWTAVESRLAATATALTGGALLLLAGAGAAAVVLLAALRPLGRVDAGPFGPLGVGFLLLAPAFLLAAAAAVSAVGRFAVTLAADAAEPRPRFARGWLLTRGAGAAPAAVWLVTTASPLAGLLALENMLDAFGGPASRSIPAAVAVGGVLALLTQFGLAPLNAGALAQLRRTGLAREGAPSPLDTRPVDTPGPLGDKAPSPLPAAPSPGLLAT